MQQSRRRINAPSRELLRFAEREVRIAKGTKPRLEKRSEARRYLVQPVVVQRVDHAVRPLGLPLSAVTRDISAQGVGLIFEDSIKHDRLALEFLLDGEPVYLLTEVQWRKPMGPFEYVGCRILDELDAFPESKSEPKY